MNFEIKYRDADEALKISYLDALIRNNNKLQAEFLAYLEKEQRDTEGISQQKFAEKVSTTKKTYQALFEQVDTEDPDWDNYLAPRSGYIEEWEAYQMASEQEFDRIFEAFFSDALEYLLAQQLDLFLAGLTGIHQATKDANIPDEVCSFDDINDFLLQQFASMQKLLAEKLRLAVLSNKTIEEAFGLFFVYWRDLQAEKLSEICYFEPVLLALAEMSNAKDKLHAILKSAAIKPQLLPELLLLLQKHTGNESDWLQMALQLYSSSKAAAKELLHYYHLNDQPTFVKIARELFPADQYGWALFLETLITPQLDKSLFVQVYSKLTAMKFEIAYYQKLKPHLDEAGYKNLLQQVSYNKAFVAQLFKSDGRYADIKTLVETDGDRWNFDQLIAPIMKVYPDYAFHKIETMIEKTLETERGRSVYQKIAKWLLLAKAIPGQEIATAHLITKTYTRKPNLPALRDEMRKAGVI